MNLLLLLILVVLAAVAAAVLFPIVAPGALLRLVLRRERRAAGLSPASVAVDGHELAYLDGGSGEPLLLLHGFAADKDNWTRVARHLTGRFRVIAPDLPPFGESAGWEGASYSVPVQVERVRELAKRLGLERFHLAGNSMGGAIAGQYAARYPQDLLSLWLLAPGGVQTAETSELMKRFEAGENPLLIETPEQFRAAVDFAMEEPPYIPGALIRYLASQAIERRPQYEAVFEELQSDLANGALPLEEALAGSQVPTLITWGDRDRLLHVSGAGILAGAIDRARVQVLEKVGHLPMIERPEQCAAEFAAFLGGGDVARGADRPAR